MRGTFEDNSNGQFVNQVLDELSKDYYRPINRQPLVNKGLAAAIAGLNDPYSHYYDPTAYSRSSTRTTRTSTGSGSTSRTRTRACGWSTCSTSSPAPKAGLSRGDVIVAVGSTSLANRSADFGSKLIRGAAGSRSR